MTIAIAFYILRGMIVTRYSAQTPVAFCRRSIGPSSILLDEILQGTALLRHFHGSGQFLNWQRSLVHSALHRAVHAAAIA